MSERPLISIIVPVYNGEACIGRCLDSIVQQSYQNLEIIIINDGSTDNTGRVIEDFQRKDQRIICRNIPNAGVSNARNTGLAEATGTYVSFIDADDAIASSYIECLYSALKENGSRIATCHAVDLNPDGSVFKKKTSDGSIKVIKYKQYSFLKKYAHHVSWGALFERDLLNGLSFSSEFKVAEDTLFFSEALKKAGSITDVNQQLYFYTVQDQSLSRGSYGWNQFCEIKAWDRIVENYCDQSKACRMDCKASRSIRALKGIHLFTKYREEDTELKRALLSYARKDLPEVLLSSLGIKQKTLLLLYVLFPDLYISIYKIAKS